MEREAAERAWRVQVLSAGRLQGTMPIVPYFLAELRKIAPAPKAPSLHDAVLSKLICRVAAPTARRSSRS
jgi:hypothetical protein